ncbi:MAG: hypothetical protein EOP07_11000 [Proteobacteria bacterium]|nr:MAG: hypothetical protein EOP07_11000 [Pseudomonadota bacterium]
MKYFAIVVALLISCGVKQVSNLSSTKSELPDNYAIKSSCYALSQDLEKPIRVEADDESNIRLCAVVQKDGHLGLDLRYQPQNKLSPYPIFAMVTVQDAKGREASEMFRMESNPYSGAYELYITDGCLVGTFGGCAQSAQKKMLRFLDVLNNRERSDAFDVSLAFVAMKSDKETEWDMHNPLKKENYKFEIKDL